MDSHRLAQSLYRKGVESIGRRNMIGAAQYFREAVMECPGYVDALFNLGKTCKDLGQLRDAADAFRKIVETEPGDVEAWYMLGNTLLALEEYAEAEHCYRTMLREHDDDVRGYINLAVTLQGAGNPGAAIQVLNIALRRHPQQPDVHYNRALALLLAGEYAEGWREFEWRFSTTDKANPLPVISRERWDGTLAEGKTILLIAEQGIGDVLQFVRFIPEARRRCGGIVVECQKELITVLRLCAGVEAVVERGCSREQTFDAWAPLMSLPHILGLPKPNRGAAVPYIRTDPVRRQEWADRLSQSRIRAQVGIAWAGNPHHKNDFRRSCPPELLTPMIRGAEVVWTSLQKTASHEFPPAWRGIVADLGPSLRDFTDTGAALERLDLVITVDTAVAHLAGAMGKPVWLLLPFAPDWRWMLKRSDSPWYPSMQIFRQPRPGDWNSVLMQVADQLQELRRGYVKSLSSPGDTAQYLAYANSLQEAGLREHAIRIYRMVVHLDPGNFAAWNNLGVTLQDLGALDEAVGAFRNALRIDAKSAAGMNNLGFALLARGETASAEDLFRQGIARDAGIPDLHNNLGNALRERGALNDAIVAYRDALRLRPDFAQAHWNLAQVLLQTGALEEGWVEYEWRWRRADFTSPRRNFSRPQWNGESLAGKRILVHAEQGFGDALQFVRYVRMLPAQQATVFLECHAELTRLFGSLPGIAGVYAHGGSLPDFDVHVPMMSLPGIFRTSMASIPANVPYLDVDNETKSRWCSILGGTSPSFRVGLTWSGARYLKALLNRACPLESLLPIFDTHGVEFHSLQTSLASTEAATLGALRNVQDLSRHLNDFADTAAAIQHLDLIISVDTAVAHLAGALGVKTWVLLPFNADWRWMISRDDSPWYPTMRLFRQQTPGAWNDVVARVRHELQLQLPPMQEVRS
jgi:tetratricopeptide (TPR) repeat protein